MTIRREEGEDASDDTLAGELVLGLLSGEEAARAERRHAEDPAFAARAAAWAADLTDLADLMGEATPPDRIKATLDARLDADAARGAAIGRRTGRPRLGDLRAWQAIAASLAALAAAELAVIGLVLTGDDRASRTDAGAGGGEGTLPERVPPRAPAPAPLPAPLVATLVPEDAPIPVVVTLDLGDGALVLDPSTVAEAGRDVQLWLVREGQAPISLGVLRADGPNRIALAPADLAAAAELPSLALSIEPTGGSPTGAPTGPIVATGALRRLPG